MTALPAGAPSTMTDGREVLRGLPLLRPLPPDAREVFVGAFVPATYAFGEVVVREGEAADALYVVGEGRARVLARGADGRETAIATLGPGEVFGEAALLGGGPRGATVRASGALVCWRLDAGVVEGLLRARPDARAWLELLATHRELGAFFREFPAFRALAPDALALLLRGLRVRTVAGGEAVVREGDPPGPMFVVRQGRLRVFRATPDGPQPLAYLRRGDWFGERSVFLGQPRAATVVAHDAASLLELSPKTFRDLLAASPAFATAIEERIRQYDFRRVARVPLDFAEELLPAAAEAARAPEAWARPVAERETASPTGSPDPWEGLGQGPRARIRRMPFVAQVDEMDCGAACLAMVTRHFGRRVPLTRLRELANVAVDGTSLRGLVTAAEQLGLAARAVEADAGSVTRMPLPAIVHWQGNHWVVLSHVDDRFAWIADPASGRRRVPRAEFDAAWTGFAALFDYREAFADAPEARRGWAWMVPFVRPHVGILAQALGLAAVVSALQLALPVFSQVIVDRVLVEADRALLTVVVIGMFAVLGMSLVATLVQRYLLSWAALRFDAAALDFLTRTLLALPLRYFAARRTGDLQRRLAGMAQVRDFLVQHAVGGLSAAVQLVVAVALMLAYSLALTLVVLAAVPGYIGLLWYSKTRLRPMFDRLEEAQGRYQAFQVDAIKGIETVKALGAERTFRELMLGEFLSVARLRFRTSFTLLAYDGVSRVLGFVTTALVLWVGARQVLAGGLTIGGFVAFSALATLATGPLQQLLGLWDDLQWLAVLLHRLDDVLESEPEQGHDRSRLLPVRSVEGRVTLERVTFRYEGPESPAILEDVSLDVPAGRRVAIVGRSGSGKTTLVKLLAGLLAPTGGRILVDGRPLDTLDWRSLRQHIGFVPQETHLFSDTIARNIAFGEATPDLDAVIWAARAAAAHDFVDRLPLGYDTKIGESGLGLSGGQRQRLAIARAIYRRPPILVFDEATSALDTESERAVQENLGRLLEGRTSFIIAHRLSTVRDADLILVLEQGRLLEQGTHDELMARQGLYWYLVSQQLGS